MNTRNHVFASAAIALITALFNVSAFAIASSSDESARPQDEATNQATYPSNQGRGWSDRSAAPSGSISAPGESSEQSSQTYGPTDQSEPNDGRAMPDSAFPQAAQPPIEPPAVLSAPDEPRYTPETGDAEYGSKLNPERSTLPRTVDPPARFNDATGQ